jgi:putative ABC transport system permease protein
MKLFAFAARNVVRNKRRSILAASSVMLSILMIIVLHGFISGFMDSLIRNYTKNETGHVNLATPGYRDRVRFMPIDDYIENSDELSAKIRDALLKTEPKVLVAQRIRFGVLLSSEKGSKQAFAVAGDPETERKLLMLDSRILAGGAYCSDPGTTILGSVLAEDLGLGVGDTLKIVTEKADGGLGFKKLIITGVFKTGVNAFDGSMFQMGLEDARSLLGMEGGAQQIAVMLGSSSGVPKALKLVKDVSAASGQGSLSILPWDQIGEYPKLIKMLNPVYIWAFLVVAFLGAFIIANVMTMVVLERKREIGILMSMGMSRKRILALFLVEGSLIGLGGSTVGGLLGWGVNAIFARIGFDMTSAMAGLSWPLDNVIFPSAGILSPILGIVIGTAVAACVAYFPSRKAARLAPIDAIRSV